MSNHDLCISKGQANLDMAKIAEAEAPIAKAAADLMAADPALSRAHAYRKALTANPGLYTDYDRRTREVLNAPHSTTAAEVAHATLEVVAKQRCEADGTGFYKSYASVVRENPHVAVLLI